METGELRVLMMKQKRTSERREKRIRDWIGKEKNKGKRVFAHLANRQISQNYDFCGKWVIKWS